MNDQIVYLTPEGMAKIKEELEYLKNVRRPEIAEKLRLAIAEGDLKENADYHDAKEQQGLAEGRIRDLEDSLRRSKLIEDRGPSNTVRVGSTVTIAEVGFEDEEEIYRIVGVHEANPTEGFISNESPIGSALLGAKKGQAVKVETPRGILEFKVLKID
ncbi:MAG: transcription elongation factor GreA [Anaerolineales bacterium]|nr:transcription elongation factor GreA [Anaerolineales bacterium]